MRSRSTLRTLAIIGTAPTPQAPDRAIMVRTQLRSLRALGIDIDVWALGDDTGSAKYLRGVLKAPFTITPEKYDLVHAHFSLCGMVARAQWRVPVVVSFMGSDLLGLRLQSGPPGAGRVAVALGRLLADQVDAVIVKSEEMRRHLRRKDVHVIPNGVDFDLFRPIDQIQARQRLGLEPDRKYVIFASNPDRPEKNFPLARAAVQLARTDVPNAELLVVSGKQQEELPWYYSAADALLLTSTSEGSPNVVKEAMAMNLPVVSVDVGDVREIIGTTEGCYVRPSDAPSLAEALVDVLSRSQRTNGREAITHLSLPAVARRIVEIYESVLRRRRDCQR